MLQPGEYPHTGPEVLDEMQIDFSDCHVGSRTALYDMRVNDDLNVFRGCGLGARHWSTPSLQADQRVFSDPRWTEAPRADLGTLVQDGYRRAGEVLKPTPLPDRVAALKKLEALADSSTKLPGRFNRLPINVTFTDHVNHVGVEQKACTLCEDCVSGFNYPAAAETDGSYWVSSAPGRGTWVCTDVGPSGRSSLEPVGAGRWLLGS